MFSRVAAFLDRDGVINVERNYVYRIEDFQFLPGALDACRQFVNAGYMLVIITNQAGIARGYYSVADFELLTNWMAERFSDASAPLSGVYYCPHHPDAKIATLRQICNCRKPAPGLIMQAQRELNINLKNSFLVGDKSSDIEAGHAAGVGRCFLVRSGHELEPDIEQKACMANSIVANLSDVAALIRSK